VDVESLCGSAARRAGTTGMTTRSLCGGSYWAASRTLRAQDVRVLVLFLKWACWWSMGSVDLVALLVDVG
jgi:hypothetical protein